MFGWGRAALSPVQQAHRGVVEAVCGADLAVLGAARVHSCPHLASKNLAELHTPLVEGVDAPNESLQKKIAVKASSQHSVSECRR